MRIHLIAAARPNFMKIAPLYHALRKQPWAEPVIVHTGQHYDLNMSDVFFRDLALPAPHLHMGVGSGTHAEQSGHVMMAYERILLDHRPDLVTVVGDVNSTMACTLAAVKIHYNSGGRKRRPKYNRPLVAHLEAGLRSFDRTMPEEINRLVTDSLADILWTPSADGDENLLREGVPSHKIDRVGNIMIDSLEMLKNRIETAGTFESLNLTPGRYGVVTLHRPSNVDDPDVLEKLCRLLVEASRKIPLVFPMHPRTMKTIQKYALMPLFESSETLKIIEPLSYIRFMNLVFNCRFALTDSGGIQEETSYLGIPCLTLRPNTERPVTVTQGTNRLCSPETVEDHLAEVLQLPERTVCRINLWDGRTSDRVVQSIQRFLQP
jgi:UDP-N-acetylglucosamine 2-epimerase (non-hydrolysing)